MSNYVNIRCQAKNNHEIALKFYNKRPGGGKRLKYKDSKLKRNNSNQECQGVTNGYI